MGFDTQKYSSDEDEETGKPSVEVREVGGMRQVINLDSEEEKVEGSTLFLNKKEMLLLPQHMNKK